MIRKVEMILRIILWCTVGAFLMSSVWIFVDYKTHPDLYATYSAPWYTGIMVHGAVAAILIIICLLAIRIVSNKS